MAWLVQLLDDVVVHKFEISKPITHIGRKPSNDIVIDDNAVSGAHASITLKSNPYFSSYKEAFIEDLGSTNGTALNGVALVGQQRLRHNDVVKIAWNSFKFIDENEAEMEKTAHMLRTQSTQQ